MIEEEFKIKGMICGSCLKILTIELRETGAIVKDIQLGNVVLQYDPAKIKKSLIHQIIHQNEFEILWNKENILAEQTKRWMIVYTWHTVHDENLSNYLTKKLNSNYDLLSKNFSEVYGSTIERYHVKLKIERVKELIENEELNFSEIAWETGYQNLSSLSRQFKKETGITLSEYKNLEVKNRIPLNKL